jgi:acyl-CoA synthetase (AMP-forming)/AMP-acid ligase II
MSDWSFAQVWDSIADAVPSREAIVCGETRRTYGELEQRAAGLASWLWAQGVRPDDKVAINLTNRPEYLETFYAAGKLGAVPVNVNYRYKAQERPGMGASSALASQSLRPYWHVFIAYAVPIAMVMLWAGSIAKRLADVERRLGE